MSISSEKLEQWTKIIMLSEDHIHTCKMQGHYTSQAEAHLELLQILIGAIRHLKNTSEAIDLVIHSEKFMAPMVMPLDLDDKGNPILTKAKLQNGEGQNSH